MKEIKVRAWNASTKEFMSIENGLGTHFDFSDGYGLRCKEGVVLIQFTGLKDKNGKEIYEGDIIQTRIKHISIIGFSHQKFCLFSSLGDINNHHFWNDLGEFAEFPGYDKTRKLEVIGNIYENPELLKEK